MNGPAKFRVIRINHRVAIVGIGLRIPLLDTRLRVWVREYMICPPPNMPDEVIPCASIIQIPPTIPKVLGPVSAAITILMCTTEE